MHYYGFVYMWTNTKNNKKYIGSHHGREDDGYVGSGVLFKRAYKIHKDYFKREILEYNVLLDDISATYELEQKYLDMIEDIHLNEEYYNLSSYAAHYGGWNKGLTKETDERLMRKSISSKGISPWNKDKSGLQCHDDNTKYAIGQASKNRHITNSNNGAYEKISKSKIGKTKENDNGRRIVSEKMKGNKNGANRKNTPKNKIWINSDGVSKMIFESEFNQYDGWNRGRK